MLATSAHAQRLRHLPAQFEGIFRRHMIIEDVGVRDSAFYSVTDEDWPQVRANLQRRLADARARDVHEQVVDGAG